MSDIDDLLMREFDNYDDEDCLPPHKRAGYAERMYCAADAARKAAKENAIIEAAEAWAVSTGAPASPTITKE